MLKKVCLSVTEDDLKQIDMYCLAHNLTRSAFIMGAAIQTVEVSKLACATQVLNHTLREFQETGLIDTDDKDVLDAIETLYERGKKGCLA